MKLLTLELIKQFENIGSQENITDPIVVCKYFDPCSQWTWYATEYYSDDKLFFGLVQGCEEELGYFTLADLEGFRSKLGIGIERDLYFTPCRLSELTASS